MNHTFFMEQALSLAEKGVGAVNPNPLVGAVIVKNGNIIGEGYHAKYGHLHAERNALLACGESPKGATLYVTLEPCCHHGKTPPCTDAILESGISTVVIGAPDPNPRVNGGGVKVLRDNGITVITGVLEEKCRKQNEIFFHYITKNTPYVLMKYAMTADGKIATTTGDSKWISNERSRENVHKTRHKFSAIMVGIGTVLADNPTLNTRIEKGRNPLRIICDSKLSIPIDSNIVQTAREIPTLLAHSSQNPKREKQLTDLGLTLLHLPNEQGQVCLQSLMNTLHEKAVDSVLLEGGSQLNFSMLEAKLVQKLQVYIAPKLFGGVGAKSPIGGMGISFAKDAISLSSPNITQIGDDLLLEYDVLGG